MDLFAGIRVSDYETARRWYERLLGREPSFTPPATEAVRELGEHRSLYIEEDPGGAGRALHTILVDDLDALTAAIASRGLVPDERETYADGVRTAIYREADGNERTVTSAWPQRRPGSTRIAGPLQSPDTYADGG